LLFNNYFLFPAVSEVKMKIEDLIQSHNKALQRSVEANPFLAQRLKDRLRENKRPVPSLHRAVLSVSRHPLLLYSFLFLLFTFLNLLLVEGFSIPSSKTHSPSENLVADLQSFSPDFPGSINKAYLEVMK
jgi:hypothetical protein